MKTAFLKYFNRIWHNAADLNNQTIISLIEPAKKARVLDIGFFRGGITIARFQNIVKPEIYGVDSDKAAILSAKNLPITTKMYDIEKGFPYKSRSFDIIVANRIIEHLVNVDLFVKEIYRVLKSKGYVIVSTENLSSWHNIFALILGWQAFSQHISTNPSIGNPLRLVEKKELNDTHIKIFTPLGLKDLFNNYNFTTEESFGAGYYPFPKAVSAMLSKVDPKHCAFIGIKARKP